MLQPHFLDDGRDLPTSVLLTTIQHVSLPRPLGPFALAHTCVPTCLPTRARTRVRATSILSSYSAVSGKVHTPQPGVQRLPPVGPSLLLQPYLSPALFMNPLFQPNWSTGKTPIR